MIALVAIAAVPASAQSLGAQLGDPKRCVAIVDDMGDVGFRISDSQLLADAVITPLRKRAGFDAVHYAGVATSAATMKRILATPEGAGPQDAQLAWFKQCDANAPWRVKARFGMAKKAPPEKRHWVTVSCSKRVAATVPDAIKGEAAVVDATKGEAAVVEEKRFEGKTFLEARDALAAAMPTFCTGIAPPAATADPSGAAKKPKELKPWTPPPRRD